MTAGTWALGGIFAAAILAFVLIFWGLLAAWDEWRDRYQARRRHVLHPAAADEKLAGTDVRTRYGGRNLTRQNLADEYARLFDECGPHPRPGEIIPWTPAPSMLPLRTEPLEELPRVGVVIPPGALTSRPPLPGWVTDVLGHPDVDSAVDSIMMRAAGR